MVLSSDPAYKFAISKGLKYRVIKGQNGKMKGAVLSPAGRPVDAWEYYRKNKPLAIAAPKKPIMIEKPKEIEAPKKVVEPEKINFFSTPKKPCSPQTQ